MSKILTQVKTTTTRWAVPKDSELDKLEVNTTFDVCINEVTLNNKVLPASCTSVEETRAYELSDAEEESVPFFESSDDDVMNCVKALINTTPLTRVTFKQLEELQHWIENRKGDISLALN